MQYLYELYWNYTLITFKKFQTNHLHISFNYSDKYLVTLKPSCQYLRYLKDTVRFSTVNSRKTQLAQDATIQKKQPFPYLYFRRILSAVTHFLLLFISLLSWIWFEKHTKATSFWQQTQPTSYFFNEKPKKQTCLLATLNLSTFNAQ